MKVLNFGSLNIDYVYKVPHFVQAGETLGSDSLQQFCGGKGLNQSIALARAGAPACHAGKVGSEGGMLVKRLRDNGVDVTRIAHSEEATGHAIIQVNSAGQNCILLHGGANRDMDVSFIREVFEGFGAGDILLLQNEINLLPEIMSIGHEKGMRIALNPSPLDDALLKCPLEYVRWFILNEIEGGQMTGKQEAAEIADSLLKRCPDSAVVLTLGKQGVFYRSRSETETHGIYQVSVVDTTAAGDTFTGYFLAGVLEGLTVKETLRRASIASSIAVSRKGASDSIPMLDEVLSFSAPENSKG